eukprot:2175737-Prymnesium_polylepis.2
MQVSVDHDRRSPAYPRDALRRVLVRCSSASSLASLPRCSRSPWAHPWAALNWLALPCASGMSASAREARSCCAHPRARLPSPRPVTAVVRALGRIAAVHLECPPLGLLGLDVANSDSDCIIGLFEIAGSVVEFDVRAHLAAHRRSQVTRRVLEDRCENRFWFAPPKGHGAVVDDQPALEVQVRGGRDRVDAARDVRVEVLLERGSVFQRVRVDLCPQLQQKDDPVLFAAVGVCLAHGGFGDSAQEVDGDVAWCRVKRLR